MARAGTLGLGALACLCSVVVLAVGCLVSADVAAGEQGGDDAYAPVRDKLQTCFACHGENGRSTNPQYPVLAGQHLHYVYVQLKDYKAGRRENAIMGPLAATLEKEEMLLIAQYFSEQEWPALEQAATPAQVAAAKSAASAGQCVQCHRGGYEGDSRIPRVAGQYREYLFKTMLDFKVKARNNSPAKSTLMASFDEPDIGALAEYLASLGGAAE